MTDFDFTKLFDPEFRKALEPVTPENMPLVGDVILIGGPNTPGLFRITEYVHPFEWSSGFYYLHKVPRPVAYEPGTAVTHRYTPGEVWAIRCQGGSWITTTNKEYTDREASELIKLGAWKLVDPSVL